MSRLKRIISNLSRDHSLSHEAVLNSVKKSEEKITMKLLTEREVSMRIQQKQLVLQIANDKTSSIDDMGFSVYSESNEDGLLLYLFSKIGFGSRKAIDIGGGTGFSGSNTANLILNHGFNSLVFEGEPANVASLKEEYATRHLLRHGPPKVVCTYVSPDNINGLIAEHGFDGDIDLLSIDIDSVDYYIWKSIEAARPRVMIAEIQCILGSEVSKTVPYDFSGTVFAEHEGRHYGVYNSASLKAFESLSKEKGYRLVGSSALGFNAIFLRDDIDAPEIKTISVEEALDRPFVKWAQSTFQEMCASLNWVDV